MRYMIIFLVVFTIFQLSSCFLFNQRQKSYNKVPVYKKNPAPILQVIEPSTQTQITLIGVSHGSPYSSAIVKQTIESIKPDCVILELCEDRFISISLDGSIEPYSNRTWLKRYNLNLNYRNSMTNSKPQQKDILSNSVTKIKSTLKFISSQGALAGFFIVLSFLGTGTQLLTAAFGLPTTTVSSSGLRVRAKSRTC